MFVEWIDTKYILQKTQEAKLGKFWERKRGRGGRERMNVCLYPLILSAIWKCPLQGGPVDHTGVQLNESSLFVTFWCWNLIKKTWSSIQVWFLNGDFDDLSCVFSSLLLSAIHKSLSLCISPLCMWNTILFHILGSFWHPDVSLPPHLLWNQILINVTYKPNRLNEANDQVLFPGFLGISTIFFTQSFS